MKKRLLFVDDEPNVLNGLRRSLHGMREVWDMQFVESAAAALQALEKDPYDAIISDMRMPLMDGPQTIAAIRASITGCVDRAGRTGRQFRNRAAIR